MIKADQIGWFRLQWNQLAGNLIFDSKGSSYGLPNMGNSWFKSQSMCEVDIRRPGTTIATDLGNSAFYLQDEVTGGIHGSSWWRKLRQRRRVTFDAGSALRHLMNIHELDHCLTTTHPSIYRFSTDPHHNSVAHQCLLVTDHLEMQPTFSKYRQQWGCLQAVGNYSI